MDDLLPVPGVRMFSTCLLGHCNCAIYCAHYCCLFGWLLVCPWGPTHLHSCHAASQGNGKENHPLPTSTKDFEAFEIKRGTPPPIRRQLVGAHQVPTTSSSMSTTSKHMQLLLEHIAKDPGVPLLNDVQNMLAEVGMTAEEGSMVCGTCFQC